MTNQLPRTFLLLAAASAVVALTACAEMTPAHGPRPEPPPRALVLLESRAEDAFDLALAEDVEGVLGLAEQLSGTWDGYRDRARSDGVEAEAVSALDAAIDHLVQDLEGAPSTLELARSVNAVSAPMASFYSAYQPEVPAEVLTLDYVGRELRLDAMAHDYARARTDVEAMTASWRTLRPRVVRAGGVTEAAAFDRSIDAEQRAIASERGPVLDEEARAQLELVDDLERVFGDTDEP